MKYTYLIITLLFFGTSAVHSHGQEVLSSINSEWIARKKFTLFRMDSLLDDRSKAAIADAWNVGTLLDPRQKRAEQPMLADSNTVIIAPFHFLADNDTLTALVAFQGGKEAAKMKANEPGMWIWPAKSKFIARIIVDEEKLQPYMMRTFILGVQSMMNLQLSTLSDADRQTKLSGEEWVGPAEVLFVDSINLTGKYKRTDFGKLGYNNLKVIRYQNMQGKLRDPKFKGAYLDRHVIKANGKRFAITYLYTIHAGLKGYYVEELPERVSGEINPEYLHFLLQEEAPIPGKDPRDHPRKISYPKRF
ncbi:MAG: hypothetical protein RL226_430 [Bacteroidota bacterium]